MFAAVYCWDPQASWTVLQKLIVLNIQGQWPANDPGFLTANSAMRRARKGQAGNGQHNGDSSPVGQLVRVFSAGMGLETLEKLTGHEVSSKMQMQNGFRANSIKFMRRSSWLRNKVHINEEVTWSISRTGHVECESCTRDPVMSSLVWDGQLSSQLGMVKLINLQNCMISARKSMSNLGQDQPLVGSSVSHVWFTTPFQGNVQPN